jgi:hypothetical protein
VKPILVDMNLSPLWIPDPKYIIELYSVIEISNDGSIHLLHLHHSLTNRHTMTLFSTSQPSLPLAIGAFTPAMLQAVVDTTIFKRGRDYYASGAVEDIEYSDKYTLEATVSGMEAYTVMISLEGNAVLAYCDCPYDGGVCKHIVAAMLEAVNEGANVRGYTLDVDEPVSTSPTATGKAGAQVRATKEFREYVESLSAKQLQELVLRYAPENFRQAVLTRSLTMNDAEKVMNGAHYAIQKIFDNDYLRHDNAKLEDKLMQQLERVRGLWEKFPERVAEMLIEIITTIDDGFEEGDFYDDEHDDGFSSQDFDVYVVQFLRSLPAASKHTIVEQFQKTLDSKDFSAFSGIERRKAEWFGVEELPDVKKGVLTAIRNKTYTGNPERDYEIISSSLSDAERELMLRALYKNSSTLTLELSDFYENVNNPGEALKVVDDFLFKGINRSSWWNPNLQMLLKRRLTLASQNNEPKELYYKKAEEIVTNSPNAELLSIAAAYIGSAIVPLERRMEKEHPDKFFQYLNQMQRFEECWSMVEAKRVTEERIYEFAVEQLHASPERAKGVLIERIERREALSDSDAYSDIVEALKQLQKIDTTTTQEIVSDLRTTYKRRTNLMKQLNAAFSQ